MPLPLAALAVMAAGTVARVGANLYKQANNRDIYRNEERAMNALDTGYSRYLARQGLNQNPNRSWSSYHGATEKAKANIRNSYADTVSSLGGGITGLGGIGGSASQSLFDSDSLRRIYNRL